MDTAAPDEEKVPVVILKWDFNLETSANKLYVTSDDDIMCKFWNAAFRCSRQPESDWGPEREFLALITDRTHSFSSTIGYINVITAQISEIF